MEIDYPPIVQVTNTGEVIGPVKYEDAHPRDPNTQGIRHLTANILIFEDRSYDRLLLTRKGASIDRGGVLVSCVGGNAIWIRDENRTQTPTEAAISELEEVFYQMPIPSSFGLRQVTSFPKDLRVNDPEYVALFEGFSKGPFALHPVEVSEAFFKETNWILEDTVRNPQLYAKSAGLYLRKFLETKK